MILYFSCHFLGLDDQLTVCEVGVIAFNTGDACCCDCCCIATKSVAAAAAPSPSPGPRASSASPPEGVVLMEGAIEYSEGGVGGNAATERGNELLAPLTPPLIDPPAVAKGGAKGLPLQLLLLDPGVGSRSGRLETTPTRPDGDRG